MAAIPQGSTGYGSYEVNGQLVPIFQGIALYPGNAVGPTYRGVGSVPPPSIPVSNGGPGTTYGAVPQPFGITRSPALLLVVMFAIGILWLRFVHWRG